MAAAKRVLVIGGGIGGLTAAIALRQRGVDVDLVEIKQRWTVYGVGIFQSNNALRALDRIGLAAKCVQSGGPFSGFQIYNKDGRYLMSVGASNAAAPAYPALNGIARPELHRILIDSATEEGVSVRLGTSVTDSFDDDEGCHVTFSDGTVGLYDVVVAADGIYSRTRDRLFATERLLRQTGQTVWRYNLPRPPDFDWGQIHYGDRTKVGLMPISKSMIYMFLVTEEDEEVQLAAADLAPIMRDRLSKHVGLVAELREGIVDSTDVVCRNMETILLPSPWSHGRTILIGDAAHATTPHLGQGAAMAIEDGVLLGELLSTRDHYSIAFAEFMRRRFERARCVVDTSNQLASWELDEWHGHVNPANNPGELNYRTSLALLDDY